MTHEVVATRATILGRGIEQFDDDDDAAWQLTRASMTRAEVMAAYYFEHQQAFKRHGSLIVCSGGYASVAHGQLPPPYGIGEGLKLADYLMTLAVPASLLGVENRSGSTFDNFVQCLDAGFFVDPREPFTPDDPLLVTASKSQGRRRGIPIARTAYGIRDPRAVRLLAAEHEHPATIAREYVGGIATKIAIAEANVEPFDAEALALAGYRFEELAKDPRQLLPAAAHFYGQLIFD